MARVLNLAWPPLFAAAAAAWLTAPAGAAPVTFNTALPVAAGQFVVRSLWGYGRSGTDPSGLDRNRREDGLVHAIGYGIDAGWTIFGVLPYRRLRLASAQGAPRRAQGWGDAQVFLRYSAWRRDARGRTLRLAPFAGLELPTGRSGVTDALGRLPAPVQPGSGAYDAFAGVVVTYQTLRYQLDAQFRHQANGTAHGRRAGDVTQLDASLQYRLHPRRLSEGTPDFFYGLVELNLVHQGRDAIARAPDPHSGGTRVFLGPGVQYVTRRWIAEAVVQWPVVQDLNGTALEAGSLWRAGLRFHY